MNYSSSKENLKKNFEIIQNQTLEIAHKSITNNMDNVLESKKCVCLYCMEKSTPKEIITKDSMLLDICTCVCPKCGVDALLPDNVGIDINNDIIISALAYIRFNGYAECHELMTNEEIEMEYIIIPEN